MQTPVVFVCCGVVAYLLGAVPFGFLIARCRGIDIRRHGAGFVRWLDHGAATPYGSVLVATNFAINSNGSKGFSGERLRRHVAAVGSRVDFVAAAAYF